MANQSAVNTILNRIKQLQEQQQELFDGIIGAEVIKDGSTDSINRLIKDGQSANASIISTQVQQPAQKEIENNLQQLVATERNIAQLNAQVARLTGQIPPDFAKELGSKTSADLQTLLEKDPAAFERATVEIYTAAARRSAESLRQNLNTIDFGDERLQALPSIPSAIVYVTNPDGFSQAETLEKNAQQQYQQFIIEEATKAIPKYANSASPPPVAVTTTLPGATGGATLTRVQNSAPAAQSDISGRDIAIATGAALIGSAALNFINNRGNVVPSNTPGITPPVTGTPIVVLQQSVGNTNPQISETVGTTSQNTVQNSEPQPVGGFYASEYDPQTGLYNVVNEETGEVVASGLSQQEATVTAQDFSAGDPYATTISVQEPPMTDILTEPEDISLDQQYQDEDPDTILDLNTGQRVTAGEAQADAARIEAQRQNLRNQQSINEQRGNNRYAADWRVRLRLAPSSTYLYNAVDPGILEPLRASDGVIFPYTPSIQTIYKANYNSYDLTHSNYRGYFYQSSYVDDVQITGIFTAQDSLEAEYLLAVIHFFRSVTKMFYGQDTQRGAPPPLVYLTAFGQYQYIDAPCVVSSFNYNLPADVDYIRARAPNQDGTNLLKKRIRQDLPTNAFSYALQALKAAGLPKGGKKFPPAPPTLGQNSPTYVPTKMEITVVLHPIQSRKQVSQQFSVKEYASGRLQSKGYW